MLGDEIGQVVGVKAHSRLIPAEQLDTVEILGVVHCKMHRKRGDGRVVDHKRLLGGQVTARELVGGRGHMKEAQKVGSRQEVERDGMKGLGKIVAVGCSEDERNDGWRRWGPQFIRIHGQIKSNSSIGLGTGRKKGGIDQMQARDTSEAT